MINHPKWTARRLALALALIVAATLAVTTRTFAIVNGVEDTESDFPSVAAIVAIKTPTTFPGVAVPQSISTCTLIHPRVVLTAGHTVAFMELLMETGGLELSDFRVTFDNVVTPDDYDSASFIEIDALITPDLFVRPDTREASLDVAVIVLKTPVVGVPLVNLAPAGLLDQLRSGGELGIINGTGTPFVVAGYGTDAGPPATMHALPSGIRRWAVSGYLSLEPSYLTLWQNVGRGEGGVGNGDSGGPAYWIDPDSGQLTQVGMTSFLGAGMGVFTRTDLPEVHDFLEEVVELADR